MKEKMIRGQYKGRNRKQFEEWVRSNADYYTVLYHQPRYRHEVQSLEEAFQLAERIIESMANTDRRNFPVMIYAVKGLHQSLVGNYHPKRGLIKAID
jgi:hypothetical protein